ncbi:MAG TPA: adenylate kinase [Opitutaceae bacterium]|nr:adenylate kinase [Opitutaceae bacterium]
MPAINDLFSRFGLPAKAKILVLGPADFLPATVRNQFSSLNLEHVSPSGLMRTEISRRRASGPVDEAAALALLRRWYFARKPDAGFLLTEFPATLLQAMVFDEWLDARDEALDAVLLGPAPAALAPVVEHYRTLGLLCEAAEGDRAA